jgi:hypothetical protein
MLEVRAGVTGIQGDRYAFEVDSIIHWVYLYPNITLCPINMDNYNFFTIQRKNGRILKVIIIISFA